MGRPAARRPLIRKSNQLHDSDDDCAPSRNKKARLDASPTPEGEEADKDDEADDDDDTLPTTIKARLKYIESHIDGLTNTYLRMIMAGLDHYMGSRSGNAQVADDIVQHCRIVAYTGRSNLLEEKRAVHQAHAACWGGCVGDEDEDDPDFYDVPQAVRDRVRTCMELMDELPKEELVEIMEALKTYKGPHDGYDLVGNVTDHLDDLATKRHDIIAEERIIQGIYDAHNSKESETGKGSKNVQARREII